MAANSLPHEQLPNWAMVLKLRRIALGKTQEQIANDSGVLTQRTVSELERAKYGLEDITVGRLAALARALEWTLPAMQEATGLDFGMAQFKESQLKEKVGYLVPTYPLSEASKPNPKSSGTIVIQDARNYENFQVYIMEGDEMVSSQRTAIHPGYTLYTDLDSKVPTVGKDYIIVYKGIPHVRTFAETGLGPAFVAANPLHPLIPASAEVVGRVYRRVGIQDDSTLN